MNLTYQSVINRIKVVAEAHEDVYSIDVGRELEFDIKKKHEWPRFFIKTIDSPIQGGLGTVEISVNFEFLLTGLVKADRSDIVEVMNTCHSAMLAILATLNKDQVIRVEDNPILRPLYDFQDTQSSGWRVAVRAYLDAGFTCYTVD